MSSKPTKSSVSNSETNLIPISHTWTIGNFHKYCDDNLRNFPSIKSTNFASPDGKTEFHIVIRPKGINEEYQEYIGLFLQLDITDANTVQVLRHFSIVDVKGVKRNIRVSTEIYSKERVGYGYYEFVKRSEVLNPANGLLSDGKLTIYCEANIYSSKSEEDSIQKKLSINPVPENLSALLESGKLMDVTLIVKGGKKLQAHKAILGARSPFFLAMFEHETKENQENRVSIAHLDFKIAQQLLRYIYSGMVEAEVLTKLDHPLLIAADMYGLEHLKLLCEQSMITKLTSETASDYLLVADMYNADNLMEKALELIDSKTQDTIQAMIKGNPDMLIRVFKIIKKAKVYSSIIIELRKIENVVILLGILMFTIIYCAFAN